MKIRFETIPELPNPRWKVCQNAAYDWMILRWWAVKADDEVICQEPSASTALEAIAGSCVRMGTIRKRRYLFTELTGENFPLWASRSRQHYFTLPGSCFGLVLGILWGMTINWCITFRLLDTWRLAGRRNPWLSQELLELSVQQLGQIAKISKGMSCQHRGLWRKRFI